jgi:hypothetical protein
MEKFESAWWSIELLPGWRAKLEDLCTSISSDQGVGALQVSAYKHDDRKVSDRDLYDFSEGEYPSGVEVKINQSGAFRGLQVSFTENGRYWRKWWLCNDTLLLFVTYNCSVQDQDREATNVDQIIATLKSKVPAA